MASVVWTIGAREDLRRLIIFIGSDSETYAAALVGRIMPAVDYELFRNLSWFEKGSHGS